MAWTGDAVIEGLVAFFRGVPDAPIKAERGDIAPVLRDKPIAGIDLVRAALAVLGPRSEHAHILLARARARAKGISAADLCAEMGWAPATMHRRVAVAAADVAAWLDHQEALASETIREPCCTPTSN